MSCPYLPEINAEEFWGPIRDRVRRERVPLTGSLELTFHCNLRCVHCYITQAESIGEIYRKDHELGTGEICNIMDQVVDEGCLFLLLTGGEPLLRSDFVELYTYAKRKGLVLTLFTNGTLVTPELADFLGDWQPRLVEITLYGYTRETYERVTGVPGSYERCRRGIDLLQQTGVRLALKTMVLTLNRHELPAMWAFAESLGLAFRHDATVHASIDSSHPQWDYRLSPDQVVRLDLDDSKTVEEWKDLYARFPVDTTGPGSLFRCGAGRGVFHVDAYGRLAPCMSARHATYDLRNGSFREGWRQYLHQVILQRAPAEHRCSACELQVICRNCPGVAYMETGDPGEVSEYMCRVAHLRASAFGLQAV
jgi:radical SAM protein with 4Fe4S-binding SPASM domain